MNHNQNSQQKKIMSVCMSGIIAALYVALTMLSRAVGLDSGVIQLRLGEALCILPLFSFAAVPGLMAGCLIANLFCLAPWQDLVFGTLATFLGALVCALMGVFYRRGCKVMFWLSPLPNILSNTLIIPLVLRYAYDAEGTLPYFMLTVGVGEVLASGVIGLILFVALRKRLSKICGF